MRIILVAEYVPKPYEIFPNAQKIDEQLVNQHYLRIAKSRALWDEIHSQENPTRWWFKTWVERVPKYGCGCYDWLLKYIITNPPRYDDWYNWTVELHDAVNVKLGKPI